MNNIRISIIMPVFNAQNILTLSVGSLMKQTLREIEILIIDDCSTDNTEAAVREMAKDDERIKYFRLEKNSGPGIARNKGLEMAAGEYIGFMDSDDIVAPDMFEKLYNAAAGADVVVSGYADAVLNTDNTPEILNYTKTGQDILITDKKEIIRNLILLDKQRLYAFLWNKLYKKEVLEGKLFSSDRLNEDYCFNCLVWKDITSLKIIDSCDYYYIDHSNGSLSRKYIPNYFEIMYNKFVITKNLFENEELFDGDIKDTVCNMHVKHILGGISKLFFAESGMNAKEIKAKIKEILKHETCIEACRGAKASRIQEKLCNFILSSGSVFLIYNFSKAVFILKNSLKSLFGKIK